MSHPNPDSSPILDLEQVSLQTMGSYLLQDISLTIQPGEIIGLVGASGSGKTSLLRLLNNLTSPSQGKISLGRQPFELYSAVELRRRLVLVPQEPKLLGMTVMETLSYPLKLQQGASGKKTIDTWINLLRIPPEWLSKTELQLSLGQRQLVSIARALIMQPQILLLDEPTSALDVGIANHLLKVLKKLNQEQNLTIMIVNHQLELIQDFCDRLLLLEHGILLQDTLATPSNWQAVSQQICRLQSEEAREWL